MKRKIVGDNIKRWTITAINCYNQNCNCLNCSIYSILKDCRMKLVVSELIKRYGKPNKDTLKNLTKKWM